MEEWRIWARDRGELGREWWINDARLYNKYTVYLKLKLKLSNSNSNGGSLKDCYLYIFHLIIWGNQLCDESDCFSFFQYTYSWFLIQLQ